MLIYICDDTESDLIRLKKHLDRFSREKMFPYDITAFSASEKLMAGFGGAAHQPELIFLDIYMDGKNGMDTARQLRGMGYQGGIIFTTSSTEHAMDSYEVNALYYLQKPYDYKHFAAAMERCGGIFEKAQQQFTFTVRKKTFTLPYADIVFFETGRHTVLLHTLSETVSFTESLSNIVRKFRGTDTFLPVGGSYLINLNHVAGQSGNDLVMSDGSVVQIPLKKRGEILAVVRPLLSHHQILSHE
ncbi:MAG: response regulator transcription factor [Lachnospiraceae bacterium]|nr:response regulator transcription factor [Butyrivibrio sp.]MCM1342457.1 response regulator transcription factor [Muribaculaceae bacterium]MCM1410237.1 response regulator transcription factor [Lachnospiraceae bacterium]